MNKISLGLDIIGCWFYCKSLWRHPVYCKLLLGIKIIGALFDFNMFTCLGRHSRLAGKDKAGERASILEHYAIEEKPDEGSCGCFSP